MKKSFSIFIGICSLFCLATKVIASPREKANAKNVQRSHGELSVRRIDIERTVAPFPGIYYTDTPREEERSNELVNFVAQIDHQGNEYIDENTVRVLFLVRNEKEYGKIDEINPNGNMNVDEEKTAKLQAFINTPSIAGRNSGTIEGFPCYRDIDGMFDFMDDLVVTASGINNLVVEKIDIGDSWEKTENSNEGDDMFAIKITGEGVAADGLSTEKGITFITCGIHAREYSPPELCARWLEALVEGYGNDADVTSILDHTEIHVVLESNPDGRRKAETNRDLYWRKNTRNGCVDESLQGVDLNRNFPFKWGYPGGSSGNSCDPTYRGSAPASEPEVQAITEYAKSVFPAGQRQDDPENADLDIPYPEDTTVGVFLDIHAYGDLLIWPYSYENQYCPNEEGLNAFARKLKHYNGYTLAGPLQDAFLYPASGVTDEWFYKVLGAAGFTYELGTEFYQDCQTFEDTIFPDNIPGLMYLAKVSYKPYSLVKGPDVMVLNFPGVITYPTTRTFLLSAAVSDNFLSEGPGNYPPSEQNIASITYSFDIHPYDIDSFGNGPVLSLLPVTSSSTSVRSSEVLTVLGIIDHLQGPLYGKHTIYMYATDIDGYDGPVTAESFVLFEDHDLPETPAPSISSTQDNDDAGIEDDDDAGIEDDDDAGMEEAFCLSPDAIVLVQNKGRVPVKYVSVGDNVMTGSGAYQTVFAISHSHSSKPTKFLKIHTMQGDNEESIELTPNHMLFKHGEKVSVPSKDIKVGDFIQSWRDGFAAKVTNISVISKNGFFNPVTTDGTILVGNAVVSTYTSLNGGSYLEINGAQLISAQFLFDLIIKPYRVFCMNISFDLCDKCNDNLHVVTSLKQFYDFWLQKNPPIQFLIFFMYIIFLTLTAAIVNPLKVLTPCTVFLLVRFWLNKKRCFESK